MILCYVMLYCVVIPFCYDIAMLVAAVILSFGTIIPIRYGCYVMLLGVASLSL